MDTSEGQVAAGHHDTSIAEFSTYEEYLDSQITPVDLYYLEVCTSFQNKLY